MESLVDSASEADLLAVLYIENLTDMVATSDTAIGINPIALTLPILLQVPGGQIALTIPSSGFPAIIP